MKMINPKMEVVRFNSEDVIATSIYLLPTDGGDYIAYDGTMQGYNSTVGAWEVTLGDFKDYVTAGEYNEYTHAFLNGSMYEVFRGTNPSDFYTNGVSFADRGYSSSASGGGAGQAQGDNPLDD